MDKEIDIGLVVGNEIGTYLDDSSDTIILTVEGDSEDDKRTVQLLHPFGEESCPISNFSNVIIIKVTDTWEVAIVVDTGISPSVDEGEKEIFSVDPLTNVKKMRILLKNDGGLEITNGIAEFTIDGTTNQISMNGHLTVDV